VKFIYTDPRELDGTCFEVAGAACRQAEATAVLLKTAIVDAFKMARVAEMERQLIAEQEPDGIGFTESPQGKKLIALEHAAHGMRVKLRQLAQSAEYDPNAPEPDYEDISRD
jgi:hypothetical protein